MARQEIAEEIIGYVYLITNNINGKIYIGETITALSRRFNAHLNGAFNKKNRNYNCYFYNAIRKYGKSAFTIKLIEKVIASTKKEAKNKIQSLEKYYIKMYKSNNNKFGYNLDSGGNGGKIVSETTKEKQRNIKLSDPKNKERLAYARSFQNPEKKIKQYNYYTGEFIKKYNSIKEAANILGIDNSGITRCCKYPNKHKYLKVNNIKYTFRYENEDYVPVYTIKMTLEDNSFIDYLVDTIHCYEKYHIDKSQIIRCCKGKNNYAGKYNNLKMCWSYA